MAHRDEIDIDRIQHQLYRHEHQDDVPPRHKAEDPDRKDDDAEHHVPA
jgi:hypothetical protein